MDLHKLKKRIQELRGEISDLVALDKENRSSFVKQEPTLLFCRNHRVAASKD
jgi:hypothetical protein